MYTRTIYTEPWKRSYDRTYARISLAQQERVVIEAATEDKTWVMGRGQEVFITQITDRGLVMQYCQPGIYLYMYVQYTSYTV